MSERGSVKEKAKEGVRFRALKLTGGTLVRWEATGRGERDVASVLKGSDGDARTKMGRPPKR